MALLGRYILGLLFLLIALSLSASADVKLSLGSSYARDVKSTIWCVQQEGRLSLQVIKKGKFVPLAKQIKQLSRSNRKLIAKKKIVLKATLLCEWMLRHSTTIPPTETPTPSPVNPPGAPTETPTPSPTLTLVPTPFFSFTTMTEIALDKATELAPSSRTVTIQIACVDCADTNVSFDTAIESGTAVGSVEVLDMFELSPLTVRASQERLFSLQIRINAARYKVGDVSLRVSAHIAGQAFPLSELIQVSILSDTLRFPDGIFVTAASGLDTNPGTPTSPVRSLAKAIDLATQRFTASPNAQVKIFLGSGSHYVTGGAIVFNQQKIGLQGGLSILPLDDAKPEIVVGRALDSQQWSALSGGLWRNCSISLPTASTNADHLPISLYRNKQPLVPARFPNTGSLTVTQMVNAQTFEFNSAGFPSIAGSVPVHVSWNTTGYTVQKAEGTLTGNRIAITRTLSSSAIGVGTTFFIEGPIEFLDSSITNYDNRTFGEYAYTGGCIYVRDTSFQPTTDSMEVALSNDTGGIRIWNGTLAQNGSVWIEGVHFLGGALAAHHGFQGNVNICNDDSSSGLLILDSAVNTTVRGSRFGPSGSGGVIGYRATQNIDIQSSVFENITGTFLGVWGRNFRENSTSFAIMVKNNIFKNPNPNCIKSYGVSLGWVGDSNVESNYFSGIQSTTIGFNGDRYYYLAKYYCENVSYSNLPNDQAIARCAMPDNTIPELPWMDSQRYNPTKRNIIANNFIDGGLETMRDVGFIYLWGLPYDPLGIRSVTVKNNFVINRRASAGSDHTVLIYNDDGSNAVNIQDNITLAPQGHAYQIIAKGYDVSVSGNLMLGAEESNSAMMTFAEFQATTSPTTAEYLQFNRELNRKQQVIGNGFFQIATGNPISTGYKIADFLYFSNWDPSPDDGYGYLLNESRYNYFYQTPKATQTLAVRIRPVASSPENEQSKLSLDQWKQSTFTGGRRFDNTSIVRNPQLPSVGEMLQGKVLPQDPVVRQGFSHLEGVIVGTSAPCLRSPEACQGRTLVTIQ